jgi:hypothetical protein
MNESRKIFEGNMSKAWSILTCPFDHPSIMFRRDFFIDNDLFYDESIEFTEDWELWLRAFEKGMMVGCIHEQLTHHRWHSGSAGQTGATADMMNNLARSNFARLGVSVPDDFAYALRPWNGKLSENDCEKLSEIFNQAIEANHQLQLYDSQSLRYVLDIRMKEARTGMLPDVVVPHTSNSVMNRGLLMRILKKLVMPLYRPFYNKVIEPLRRIENGMNNLQGQDLRIEALMNEVQKLREQLAVLNRRLNDRE